MTIDTSVCPCGLPLHYPDLDTAQSMLDIVAREGPLIRVTTVVKGVERTWQVSRHYIALHGLKAVDLPALGPLLGFMEVTGEDHVH